MDQNIWEYDDFIFKGDELKGMTAKGKARDTTCPNNSIWKKLPTKA